LVERVALLVKAVCYEVLEDRAGRVGEVVVAAEMVE
jgi:hypothetical protein